MIRYILIFISLWAWSLPQSSFAKQKKKKETTAGFCFFCSKKSSKDPSKISVKGERKGKKNRGKVKGGTAACPFGVGPMNKARCSKKNEQIIAQILGQSRVACYSSLFMVESGCSHTIYHDAKKAHNRHAGIGLCALEKSPAIRRQNNRGQNCKDISTFPKQVKCCADIMRKNGPAYFGTVKCKKTPRCS